MSRAKILIIEDEKHALTWLGKTLSQEGYETLLAEDGEKGLCLARREAPDLTLLDIRLPDIDGLALFEQLINGGLHSVVIVMTADATSSNAIKAMQLGAFEYLAKPIDLDHLFLLIERALKYRDLEREVQALRENQSAGDRPQGLLGQTEAMREVYKLIGRVAATDTTVLVNGESGTGKELVVDAIHAYSKRSRGPLVKVNCAAIPENLLESELFGHERGAFTDAVQRRVGRFEEASGGTLFLDEVADLPLPLQAKLLRAIQDRSFARLGSNEPIHADFRLVTATAEDLRQAVAEGRFREDLYYRLNVVKIALPPLRERLSDIPLLVQRFLARSEKSASLTPDALELLLRYDWPGNVRELENVIARAIVLAPGGLITPASIQLGEQFSGASAQGAWQEALPLEDGLHEVIKKVERFMLTEALNKTSGNKLRAAEFLKINRRVLYNKLTEHGLKS
jgi:DNA-binding NtrC family response regulator